MNSKNINNLLFHLHHRLGFEDWGPFGTIPDYCHRQIQNKNNSCTQTYHDWTVIRVSVDFKLKISCEIQVNHHRIDFDHVKYTDDHFNLGSLGTHFEGIYCVWDSCFAVIGLHLVLLSLYICNVSKESIANSCIPGSNCTHFSSPTKQIGNFWVLHFH